MTELSAFKEVVVRARASQPVGVQVRLATKDAAAFAAPVALTTQMQEVRIPLSAFQPSALLLSPRPYPGFLPLQFQSAGKPAFKLADAEVLQLLVDAATSVGSEPVQVDIESVQLR